MINVAMINFRHLKFVNRNLRYINPYILMLILCSVIILVFSDLKKTTILNQNDGNLLQPA